MKLKEIGIIALVVVAVIAAIVMGVKTLKGPGEVSPEDTQKAMQENMRKQAEAAYGNRGGAQR